MLLEVQIEGPDIVCKGTTALVKGNVKFCRTVRYIKWKKYQNNEFLDINIHKTKYNGSSNDLKNPVLRILDFDVDDEFEYVLEVDTGRYRVHSNACTLKVMDTSGEFIIL